MNLKDSVLANTTSAGLFFLRVVELPPRKQLCGPEALHSWRASCTSSKLKTAIVLRQASDGTKRNMALAGGGARDVSSARSHKQQERWNGTDGSFVCRQ